MTSEKLPDDSEKETISKEAFDKKDAELSESLDKLEAEVFPPKPKPEPIGGMF